jgi:hypothetical protein
MINRDCHHLDIKQNLERLFGFVVEVIDLYNGKCGKW